MAYGSITSLNIHSGQTRFPGIPLEDYDNGYFGICYMQIKYIMPESFAGELATFWKKQNASMANVQQWFDELNEKDKSFVIRFDINTQKYL